VNRTLNPAAARPSTGSCRLWFESALLPQGWARNVRVDVSAGKIVSVDIEVTAAAGDERHRLGVPGMPNVHSHAFQRAMAGLTSARGRSSDSFWTWRELMYRFVGCLQPDDLEAIAAQAYVEMLEAGFTHVGEFHYLHHAADGTRYAELAENSFRLLSAAQDTGIGLTILPVFYAHSGFGGAAPQASQQAFITHLDEYSRLLHDVSRQAAAVTDTVVGVAPHSLRAVTPQELQVVWGLLPDTPVHIHVAEQTREVEECVAWSGQKPVAWLLDHAPVDSRWCLVHATHMDAQETGALARSGSVVGLCPITEADLGDGLFPAITYANAGGMFGIGSDSNVVIDVAQELRSLEHGQRLLHRARNALARDELSTGRALFEDASRGGAVALDSQAGRLEVGRSGDIVSLNLNHPAMLARSGDSLLDTWILATREPLVDCVWRAGRPLVRGGHHKARLAVRERYERTLNRLLV